MSGTVSAEVSHCWCPIIPFFSSFLLALGTPHTNIRNIGAFFCHFRIYPDLKKNFKDLKKEFLRNTILVFNSFIYLPHRQKFYKNMLKHNCLWSGSLTCTIYASLCSSCLWGETEMRLFFLLTLPGLSAKMLMLWHLLAVD